MALYFFHLRDGEDILLDPEGCELAGYTAITARALHTARSILSTEAMEGRLPLYLRLDIEDKAGSVIHSLRFEDAIELILPAG